MSSTRQTSRSLNMAVLVALWAVFCLQPAAANPTSSPNGSGTDRATTAHGERQQGLDTWHGIRDYRAGDEERRINLRMAVRARPYNGHTYVKGYMAVTCETLTGSRWRRYPCSVGETELRIHGGIWTTFVWWYTAISGADGFYSAYTPWVRTRCPATVYSTVQSGHAGIDGVTVGLYYRYFDFGDFDEPVVPSERHSITCS